MANPKKPDLRKAWLALMWYESSDGKRKRHVSEREMRTMETPSVKTWPYAGTCFPNEVSTKLYRRRYDGGYGSKDCIGEFRSTANAEDLVLALVTKKRFKLYDAIRTVSQACERCLNILGHQFRLGWGYSVRSKAARKVNTSCNLCRR